MISSLDKMKSLCLSKIGSAFFLFLILFHQPSWSQNRCSEVFSKNFVEPSAIQKTVFQLKRTWNKITFRKEKFNHDLFKVYKFQLQNPDQAKVLSVSPEGPLRAELLLAALEVASQKQIEPQRFQELFRDPQKREQLRQHLDRWLPSEGAIDTTSVITRFYLLANPSFFSFFTDFHPTLFIRSIIRQRVESELLAVEFTTALRHLGINRLGEPNFENQGWKNTSQFFVKILFNAILYSKVGILWGLPASRIHLKESELQSLTEAYQNGGLEGLHWAIAENLKLKAGLHYTYNQVFRKAIDATFYIFVSYFLVTSASSLTLPFKLAMASEQRVVEYKQKLGADKLRQIRLDQYAEFIRDNLEREPTAEEMAMKWQELEKLPDSSLLN